MKIAIISDLHLGFRQYGSVEREQDFYNQFYKVCKEINKCNPDITIIAGDLFDKPNPSPAAIHAYRNGISELNSDILCTIKGNHTMILRDDHYAIDDFFGEDNIRGYYFLDDLSMTTKHKDLKINITGITYRSNTSLDEFLEIQKEMAEKCSEDFYNILIVHQSFKEFCGFTGEKLSIEDINYSPYDIIICGHIHSRFNTVLPDGTKFIQPGSIERMNTTEARDEEKNGKGFYLLDIEKDSLDFHKVECSRKFFLGDIEIKTEEDFKNHLERLEEITQNLDEAPIISYNYKSYIENIEDVRKKIDVMKENVLLNKSNIDNKLQEEIVLEINDSEIPTVLEAIKMACEKTGLNEDECLLVRDLHQALNENEESVGGLLDNYFEKHKKEEVVSEFFDEELEELIEYFGE